MKIGKFLAGAAGAGALFLVGAMAAFAIGSNGSFETGTASTPYTTVNAGGTNITDWSVDSGNVDYINGYWTASDGVRSIDLNGTTQGAISQTFATVPNVVYHVTFDLSGNPDSRAQGDPLYSPSNKEVTVRVNGGQSQNYFFDTSVMHNTLSNMMWQPKTYSFTADSNSTTLQFASAIPGAFGPALDNVAISATAYGVITQPANDGDHISGTLNLAAFYYDGDVPNTDDGVQWAVRQGTCTAGQGTVLGNVDGHSDSATWNGNNFSFTTNISDSTAFPPGDYCFVFNPTDDAEQPNVRVTRNFIIDEYIPTPTLPTSKGECKKGGWETFGVFKNQGDCVSYVATGGKNQPDDEENAGQSRGDTQTQSHGHEHED